MSLITVSDRARLGGGSTLSSRPSTLHAQRTQQGRGARILGAQYMQQGAGHSEIPTPVPQEEKEGRGQEDSALQQRKPWLTLPGQVGLLSKVPRISTTVHTHSVTSVCLICDPRDCSPQAPLSGIPPGQNTGEGGHALLQGPPNPGIELASLLH